MKKYSLLMCALSAVQAFYAQNPEDISGWVISHPDVYLMTADNYNSLSENMKQKLGENVIVYNDIITPDKLQAFEQEKSGSSTGADAKKNSDAQEVKDWLGENQDVKIVKRSAYNAMSTEDKSYYIGALILIGEKLTAEDIRNYYAH